MGEIDENYIFFDVKTDAIISEQHQSKSPKYYAVLKKEDNTFLGIKRSRKHSDLVTNKKLYDNAVGLYKHITGHDPKLIYQVANSEENWFAQIITGCPLDEFSYTYYSNNKKIVEFSVEEYINEVSDITENAKKSFLKRINNFQVGFALINGYDIDYNPNIFLVILKDADNFVELLPLSRLSYYQKPKRYNISKKIIEPIEDYVSEYLKRFSVPLKEEEILKAVLYNIHDINLNALNIEIDEAAKKNVVDFDNMVSGFIKRSNNDTYSAITDFLLRFYAINKKSEKKDIWRVVRENIKEKELYKRSKSRLKKVLKDDFTRKEYEVECQKAYRNAKDVIEKLKKENKKTLF